MLELTLTKEQSDLITSLDDEQLESLIHDIKSYYHISNLMKAISPSSELLNFKIIFDGKNDIKVNMRKK